MNKHFEIIAEYCEVIEVIGDFAIYYKEQGCGFAEINGGMFTCDSLDEFHELVEQFKDEDFQE
mgnify:CR=1 FL=1